MSICMPATRFQLALVSLIAVLACARSSTLPSPQIPSPQSSSEEPTQPVPQEESSSKSWQFSPTPELQHYNTLITTNIQQSTGQVVTTDSIITRVQYSLSLVRSIASISLTGSIETFSVQAGNRIGKDTIIPSFPVSFAGQIQNHEFQLNLASTNHSPMASSLPCETPARSALTTIQRNLFITPLQIHAGMTWRDSLSSTFCSGELLLNLTILRTYKVIGESVVNGIFVVAVDLTEKTLSAGEGSQNQHRIIIHSNGLKSGHVYLDATTGLLLSFSSETRTTLQIQSSGKLQQFLQNSKEITTLM